MYNIVESSKVEIFEWLIYVFFVIVGKFLLWIVVYKIL